MTGYGEGVWNAAGGRYTIIAKSLNHRFLETRVKLPPKYDAWESEIQRKIKERFDRGRIDLVITDVPGEGKKAVPQLDLGLASRYVDILNSLKDGLSLSGEVNLELVTKMRDVIYQVDPDIDVAGLWAGFEPILDDVLAKLKDDRTREGQALAADLVGRLSVLSETVAAVEKEAPQMISHFRERLITKIKEVSEDRLNVDRIEEEVVIFADRVDFTEELVRLKSHVEGFSEALREGSPVGRKLDFLLQEMGREINTIGNKNTSEKISARIVSAKVELEKMRQQVQNIE